MARGDGRAGLCTYVFITRVHDLLVKRHSDDVFISFKDRASFRVYENKLCTRSEGAVCLSPLARPFVSLLSGEGTKK